MDRPNDNHEPNLEDAVPYRTPNEVTDGSPSEPKKFPWLMTSFVVAAVAGLAVFAIAGSRTTKTFGVTRGGPPRQIQVTDEIDINTHVEDFGAQRRQINDERIFNESKQNAANTQTESVSPSEVPEP